MSGLRLEVTNSFGWNKQNKQVVNDDSKESSSEEEQSNSAKGETKKRSKRKKIKRDSMVEKDCSKIISKFNPSSPSFEDLETLDDCDRLIVAFPNSSKAWLLYVVFHLKQAEVDKARNIAEKALKTICFREEKEKLNIWLALLNLENLYGTQESMMNVFNRALLYNEPKVVYNHLVEAYIKSQKIEEAKEMLETMVKKFKRDKDVWIRFGMLYMKLGKLDLAHSLMNRSLKSVDKKHHADILSKFAHMECKYGNIELGKSMFANLIQSYPKRKDILAIYINILNKAGDQKEVERYSSLLTNK